MARDGFYRAYKTKQGARDAAKELRKPRSAKKHGLGYPVNITMQYQKDFYEKGRGAWVVYIYRSVRR